MKSTVIFSVIALLLGIMIAIQFQTTNEPVVRDTRDVWEIRSDLKKGQEVQKQLLNQVEKVDQTIEKYQSKSEQEKLDTLNKSLEELKKKAGLTEVKGRGITISINPIFQDLQYGQSYTSISPTLLNRLINELNMYGATDIAIANERIINLSAIRSVSDFTYVNNHPLPPLPIEIKVIASEPNRLLDYMQVSQSKDYFAIENLDLTARLSSDLVLPKYEQRLLLNGLSIQESKEKGES